MAAGADPDCEDRVELDEFDRRLLDALQENNRLTGEELAAIAGLSAAACLRRVQRLRDEGVIERDVSLLAPAAIGKRVIVVVLVTLDRERPDLIDEFKRSMRDAPEVMQCHYVTGPADFVLIVAATDMADYEAFTRRHLFERHIRRFESLVVLDRVKASTAIPLTERRQP
jgi:Lrp/AsnC family transcriptional regulator, leucine-responsive regulatory protein